MFTVHCSRGPQFTIHSCSQYANFVPLNASTLDIATCATIHMFLHIYLVMGDLFNALYRKRYVILNTDGRTNICLSVWLLNVKRVKCQMVGHLGISY